MIKIANNLKYMVLKQAAAEAAKFVNHATDGSLALSPEGEYPQSYAFDEDVAATVAKLEGSVGPTDTLSSALTPREWSMFANTAAGQHNNDPRMPTKTKTFGAYGPTSQVDRNTGMPAPMRTGNRKPNDRPVYGAPFGFGSMYNMTRDQIDAI